MRVKPAVWFGLAILLLAGIISCGGNPVDAIIAEETQWNKDFKSKEVSQQDLADRKAELNRKIQALTPEQKADYEKRKPSSSVPAGPGGKRPG